MKEATSCNCKLRKAGYRIQNTRVHESTKPGKRMHRTAKLVLLKKHPVHLFIGSFQRVEKMKIQLWVLVIGWIEKTYIDSDKPGASLIADCCFGTREGL